MTERVEALAGLIIEKMEARKKRLWMYLWLNVAALIAMLLGAWILWNHAGWEVVIGMWLVMWGNNVSYEKGKSP